MRGEEHWRRFHEPFAGEISRRLLGLEECAWLWGFLEDHPELKHVHDLGVGFSTFLLYQFDRFVRPLRIHHWDNDPRHAQRVAHWIAHRTLQKPLRWQRWVSWPFGDRFIFEEPNLTILDTGPTLHDRAVHLSHLFCTPPVDWEWLFVDDRYAKDDPLELVFPDPSYPEGERIGRGTLYRASDVPD